MVSSKTVDLENKTARNIAVNCLQAFAREHKQIQETLDGIFRSRDLKEQDKRQATELAYGTCRSLISLDHIINRHSSRPIRNVDTVVLQILRVGLYQMLYLRGTPDFAVVNEAVQQARSSGLKGTDGFVNAVLRAIQRDIEGSINTQQALRPKAVFWVDETHGWQFKSDFLPDPAKNKAKYYSLAYGHPLWLIERWLKRYDEKTVHQICRANNSRPMLNLRINRLRCSSGELQKRLEEDGRSVIVRDDTISLLSPVSPAQLPGYAQGWFTVQDITATQVTKMLKPQPGERVLDMCAAPGGKTTHLAELMADQGSITACDVSRSKLGLIEENCRRLGISMVRTCLPDELQNFYDSEGPFDRILVDAPCSNTAVLARRVEARHRLKPVHIQRLSAKQTELLKKAGEMVKNRGIVLYSTCSIEPVENGLLVQKILEENRSFQLIEEKTFLPGTFSTSKDTVELFTGQPKEQVKAEFEPTGVLHHDGGYAAVIYKG